MMNENKKMCDRHLVIVHELCNGCGLCEVICSLHHEGYINRECSRIRISWQDKPMPLICLQCLEPLCQTNCPAGTIERCPDTGLLTVDHERCLSCYCCIIACPFGGSLKDSNNRMVRCDLCGGDPQCAIFCPTGALTVSTAQDSSSHKRRNFAMRPFSSGKTKLDSTPKRSI